MPVKRNELAARGSTKMYDFTDVKYKKHSTMLSLLINTCICMEKALEDAANS